MTRNPAGFSLIEMLIAVFFLGLVLVGTMTLVSQANRASMDAHYELLACQVAREPIEIFRQAGFDAVKRHYLGQGGAFPRCPLGLVALATVDPTGRLYPGDAQSFVREISIQPSPAGDALRVTVRAGPQPRSRAGFWWRGGRMVELRALIHPTPQP